MLGLIYDTETTGKWNFTAPSDDPSQPHLVQLCAILEDVEANEIVSELNVIIRPDGIVIPLEATKVHRITQERAESAGVRLSNACHIFRDMVERASFLVAHNMDFDIRIIQKAFLDSDTPPPPWSTIPLRCTMKTATPITRIPGTRGFKWPTLTECMQHFYGTRVEGAHNAKTDTMACRDIHRALMNMGAF